MRTIVFTAVTLLVSSIAMSQQLEQNDVGGSLTRFGQQPTIGAPFATHQAGSLDLRVEGLPNVGYILIAGQLGGASTAVPNGEFFDLDLGAPLLVLADGINGGGVLSNFFNLGTTNSLGQSNLSIPLSANNVGETYSFQAVVADPSLQPALNFTAATVFQVHPGTLVASFGSTSGESVVVNLPTPFLFYGQMQTQMTVTTEGLIDFDGAGFLDPSPSTSEFHAGIAGSSGGFGAFSPSSPMIAAFWEDLHALNGSVEVLSAANSIRVFWNTMGSTPLGVPLGSFSASIDFTTQPIVTIDLSGLAPASSQLNPIVGVTSGDTTATTQISAIDLAIGGSVQFFAGPPGLKQTIYQAFPFTTPFELPDLSGTTLTFIDTSPASAGEFVLF